MPKTNTIQVSRFFETTPKQLFDAWTDPKKASNFLFRTPTGEMIRAEVDPKVGGTFIFTERRDGIDVEHTGQYLEFNPPHKLIFTFTVPLFSKESTTVTIEIIPEKTGSKLTLTHENVLPEWADRTKQGWTKILENLANSLH
jgi:uncharacterized protein YndB with AHSA1/START domain